MDTRREKLLNLVIENYIEKAEPVGSKFLVFDGGLDWSEATVRNDLRALEEGGFLTHPHTSAGRVPTEKGYRFYVNNLVLEKINITRKDGETLQKALFSARDFERSRKNLARALVELSGETAILAFNRDMVYYTGLSNIFGKPEFVEMNAVFNISEVFDRCEDCLEEMFEMTGDEPRYFIGSEHPFGSMLSVVAAKFESRGRESLIALLGSQRMDYKRNWGLMKKVKEII